jgi:murein peptide amidase A
MGSISDRKLRGWVIGIWATAGVMVCLIFAGTALRYAGAQPAIPLTTLSTSTEVATLTSTTSLTWTPTQTLAPSETWTPSLSPTITETPIPFTEGPIAIGKSVQGRPLEVYRFGTGSTERLIVAGMHGGNEYNTVRLVDELMDYLRANPQTIPPDVSIYFLHALNPDGIARALNYLGRANANQVDLNRNWPANWQKDWPRTGCWITTYVTGGKKAASEPETQALMNFIESHRFSGLINYHSAALGVFPGGVPPTDESVQLAEEIAAISTYKYPPVDTGCVYTGGMVDWTADRGIPSVDLELTNHTDTDFEMNLEILKMFVSWKSGG